MCKWVFAKYPSVKSMNGLTLKQFVLINLPKDDLKATMQGNDCVTFREQ